MASTSETGHIVNISNYKLIIDGISTYTNYAPSNPQLLIAAMTAQWTEADGMHSSYLSKFNEIKTPINERETIFADLMKLITRVNNMFGSTQAKKNAKKDAYGLVKKILGRGVRVKYLPDGNVDPKHISNSQKSFVKRTENFEKLINFLDKQVEYAPNEPILKIANLETELATAKAKNDEIGEFIAEAVEFRTKRDHLLYDLETGIIDTSLLCKNYLKGLFGARAPEAVNIIKITLKRFMKMEPAKVLSVVPPGP